MQNCVSTSGPGERQPLFVGGVTAELMLREGSGSNSRSLRRILDGAALRKLHMTTKGRTW